MPCQQRDEHKGANLNSRGGGHPPQPLPLTNSQTARGCWGPNISLRATPLCDLQTRPFQAKRRDQEVSERVAPTPSPCQQTERQDSTQIYVCSTNWPVCSWLNSFNLCHIINTFIIQVPGTPSSGSTSFSKSNSEASMQQQQIILAELSIRTTDYLTMRQTIAPCYIFIAEWCVAQLDSPSYVLKWPLASLRVWIKV